MNLTDKSSIMDRAVCLNLEFSYFGTSRKLSTDLIETKADKEMLHIAKDILASKALREIHKHDNQTNVWLRGYTLPGILRGIDLLPNDRMTEVDEFLGMRATKRRPLVDAFMDEY